MKLNRRAFLKGTGVSIALPFFDLKGRPLSAESSSKQPLRRMVLIELGLGIHAPNLFPDKPGRDYELTPYLDILREFRDDFTVISGVSHPVVTGGHIAGKSYLTAAPSPTSISFKNSISVDQLAADHIGNQTRFRSLTLTSEGSAGLSYSRTGAPLPSDSRPSRLFRKLFLDGTAKDKQRQIQKLKDGQSVMDTVLQEAKRMQKRIGPDNADKLDQYLTAVRETEQALLSSQEWEKKPKPRVTAKEPNDIVDKVDTIGRARLMFDLMHLAIQTDSTRLITLANAGINGVPPIPGITYDYHNLSHHGQDPERLEQLKIIEIEQFKLLADFLGKLRGTQEGESNLLDKTMVMFGSCMGNASSHDNQNLPVILAGGGFRHGQYLAFDPVNNYPLPNLFVSMLQQLGLEVETFATSTGTMTGLES